MSNKHPASATNPPPSWKVWKEVAPHRYSGALVILFKSLFLYSLVFGVLLFLHDYIFPSEVIERSKNNFYSNSFFSRISAWILFIYPIVIFFLRFIESGAYVLYETVWCCNVSMIMASVAIFTNRPLLVYAAICVVSCDQSMWYIDLICYALTKKFPIGVAKYLIWPETSYVKKITATHHIWFLPLCFALVNAAFPFEIMVYSYALSVVLTCVLGPLCRLFTPFTYRLSSDDKDIYMNINGAYEFWRDIKIGFLHRYDHHSPFIYFPYLLVVGNLIINGPSTILLYLAAATFNALTK